MGLSTLISMPFGYFAGVQPNTPGLHVPLIGQPLTLCWDPRVKTALFTSPDTDSGCRHSATAADEGAVDVDGWVDRSGRWILFGLPGT